jgi:hypothetical protein
VRWEGPELAPGKHVIEFDFKYDGLGPATMAFGNYGGVGQGGTGVLKVDGSAVATEKMEHTLSFILQWDESLDIGSDTGSPVDDDDYATPFVFTGKIDKITLTIDRPKLSPQDVKRLEDAQRAAGDGPSVPDADAAQNPEVGPISSNIGLNLLQRIELRMDKMEGCRKQATAQKLGMIERVQFVQRCMRE